MKKFLKRLWILFIVLLALLRYWIEWVDVLPDFFWSKNNEPQYEYINWAQYSLWNISVEFKPHTTIEQIRTLVQDEWVSISRLWIWYANVGSNPKYYRDLYDDLKDINGIDQQQALNWRLYFDWFDHSSYEKLIKIKKEYWLKEDPSLYHNQPPVAEIKVPNWSEEKYIEYFKNSWVAQYADRPMLNGISSS